MTILIVAFLTKKSIQIKKNQKCAMEINFILRNLIVWESRKLTFSWLSILNTIKV